MATTASADDHARIQALLDRLQTADAADRTVARNELVTLAYQRLVCLARVILRAFPVLPEREPARILHEGWERLDRAIDQTRPVTVAAFFGLAARKIRQDLLNLAEERRPDRERPGAGHSQRHVPGAGRGPRPQRRCGHRHLRPQGHPV